MSLRAPRAKPIRLVLLGLGGVGTGVARVAAGRTDVRVVAAWSARSGHQGRSLADVVAGAPADVVVAAERDAALAEPADVALIATASRLDEVADDIEACVEAGLDTLTTAEEAAEPWAVDAEVADRLDGLARRRGVTILGAGVNPGFVFDALVVTLSGAATRVEGVEVERVVDLGRFSPAVQRRIGIGHDPAAFEAGRRSGAITGHLGFPQSMRVVARALGRTLERIESTLEPIVTDVPLAGGTMPIAAGLSAGFVQRYVGVADGVPWFEARLTGHGDLAATGLRPRDTIRLRGTPPLQLTLEPGLDAQATVTAVLVNSLQRLRAAPPGWSTTADLPPAAPWEQRRPATVDR